MADNNDKAPEVRIPSGRLSPKAGERPFDLWLHKQLHAMYDEIASEPLPNDLLKLIDNDAAASDRQNGQASGQASGQANGQAGDAADRALGTKK